MDAVIFVLVLFIIFVGGGWVLGKGLGKMLFPNEKETYIDKSVHYHYHNHSITSNHEHKNISIIDDETKEKIFELKESEENKKATN